MPAKPHKQFVNYNTCFTIVRLLIVALFIFVLIAAGSPAYAADVREVLSIQVFRHLIETDDFLLVAHTNITHDVDPGVPVDDYYHFRLMSADELTQLGAIEPYPYHADGYDEGILAFYFSAADAPVWSGAYILRLEGNPEYHAVPPLVRYVLAASNYYSGTTQAANRTALGNYVIDVALSLQNNWATEMVVSSDLGQILSSTGEAYIRGSIEGISYMAPQIFALQSSTPTVTPRTWGTGVADAYETRWAGTWVDDSLNSISDLFGGINPMYVTTGVLLFLAVALFGISFWLFQSSLPGFMSGGLVLIMGFVMGFVPAGVMGVVVLLCALYLGYILIFRYG